MIFYKLGYKAIHVNKHSLINTEGKIGKIKKCGVHKIWCNDCHSVKIIEISTLQLKNTRHKF